MRATIKRYVTLGGSSIYLEPFFKIFSWELQHNNPTSFNELKKNISKLVTAQIDNGYQNGHQNLGRRDL